MTLATQDSHPTQTDYDAVVVGAGFGGLYMLHKLRNELGMNVRVFDKAGDVGGTWYWNRYPGALSDTESFVYCYSFDKALLQEWQWDTRYVTQPQILSYLNHVADRLDLRRDIEFNTGVTGARFDEKRNLWEIQTDTDKTVTARYLITALGLLSATNVPNIKGIETFQGAQYHTGAWPEGVDFKGKRVGVIGTGSTGLQVITALAPQASHLTVFQRSPQYSVPVGNGPVSPDYVKSVKQNYEQIWKDVRSSVVAFGFKESSVPAMSVSEEERRAVYQKAWDTGGGFRFMFETFCDIATSEEANETAAAFIRGKIAEIVKDPETARKLTPTDLYAKRPLCDSGYYAIYNRDNVALVDVKATPITEITPRGIKTSDGVEHELDVLIFATGFDAVDGNYTKIDLRGRNGKTIKDKWKAGPTSYLGVASADYPNLFMILGPNGPFTNLPPSIETQVEWISDLIKHMNDTGRQLVEATHEGEDGWTATCNEIAGYTLFPKADSWIFGANIPGKARTVMFYLAGLGAYTQKLNEVTSTGYPGFEIR
ncbi:flavin-containing monooxygenase [Polaromonas sp. JS666]|jgi:cyclohexanone monooxygenase|uniref:flavin-containing monooxygenase n=1 Tax=Polaromonas sp. (strain JS666 / ATCC BAA-500) TaxID=296591 RepID=UPI00004646F7|nr:NAD(P)/FAD-dependent oxidoreductase [Polaromonas sp. JS666]ABE47414.1 flavin-containing monooxygenase FMO [Polaromonas sp. JS666]